MGAGSPRRCRRAAHNVASRSRTAPREKSKRPNGGAVHRVAETGRRRSRSRRRARCKPATLPRGRAHSRRRQFDIVASRPGSAVRAVRVSSRRNRTIPKSDRRENRARGDIAAAWDGENRRQSPGSSLDPRYALRSLTHRQTTFCMLPKRHRRPPGRWHPLEKRSGLRATHEGRPLALKYGTWMRNASAPISTSQP
jgi:hypothetical protein